MRPGMFRSYYWGISRGGRVLRTGLRRGYHPGSHCSSWGYPGPGAGFRAGAAETVQSNPARAMARAMPSTAATPMPSTKLLWLPEGPSPEAGSFEPAGSLAEEPEPRTKAGQARSGNILLGRNLGP